MLLGLYCLIVLSVSGGCSGWSLSTGGTSSNRSASNSNDANIVCAKNTSGRRNVLQSFAATTLATCGPLLSMPAHADVTNKIASSTALRSLARVQSQLSNKLLPSVQSNDYRGVKTALRQPPFDTLRKDMLVLVRGGEDGPKADELRTAYSQLIKALEEIDATASLGMQGRTKNIDAFQLGIEYDNVVKTMELFTQIGGEAAGIPLMEDTKQTQVGSIDVRSGKVTERII